MASLYLDGITTRRSIYALSKQPPIPKDKIKDIVSTCVKHTPSSFNCQAGRVIILYGNHHEKLWEFGDHFAKLSLQQQAYEAVAPKLHGLRGAYASILFFEDQAALTVFKEKKPNLPFDQWSEHSSGMLQIHIWDALELEGFGANLQHYNYMPGFAEKVREYWDLPETWDLKAQLVFGSPNCPPKEKSFESVEGFRLRTFG